MNGCDTTRAPLSQNCANRNACVVKITTSTRPDYLEEKKFLLDATTNHIAGIIPTYDVPIGAGMKQAYAMKKINFDTKLLFITLPPERAIEEMANMLVIK